MVKVFLREANIVNKLPSCLTDFLICVFEI